VICPKDSHSIRPKDNKLPERQRAFWEKYPGKNNLLKTILVDSLEKDTHQLGLRDLREMQNYYF
jgi:hypothetical protein